MSWNFGQTKLKMKMKMIEDENLKRTDWRTGKIDKLLFSNGGGVWSAEMELPLKIDGNLNGKDQETDFILLNAVRIKTN